MKVMRKIGGNILTERATHQISKIPVTLSSDRVQTDLPIARLNIIPSSKQMKGEKKFCRIVFTATDNKLSICVYMLQ